MDPRFRADTDHNPKRGVYSYMPLKKEYVFILEEDYLKGELECDVKNEYINGQIFAMGGASDAHNWLTSNFGGEFRNHLKGKPCHAFQSDFKVKVGTNYFYPDVVVKCDRDNRFYTEKPIIIIEVLSPSTRCYDETTKLRAYLTIPSLREYVLVDQDRVRVEVFRRVGELWTATIYNILENVCFDSINLTLSVEEIYEQVDNDDMRKFLAKKEDEK